MTALAIIVAVAENDVIGRNNALPWRLPEDLRYFKRVTMGKPILMGRKTFESIGHPLPGRANIVISRDPQFSAPGIQVAASLQEARNLADPIARSSGAGEIMVIGGAEIYSLALPLADRLYITRVHAEVEGDALLPAVDISNWRELSRERHPASAGNPYDYSFIVFERIRA